VVALDAQGCGIDTFFEGRTKPSSGCCEYAVVAEACPKGMKSLRISEFRLGIRLAMKMDKCELESRHKGFASRLIQFV